MALRPSTPANLIKTPFRVNPLAFGVCGVCNILHTYGSRADELETFTDGIVLRIHKRMGYLAKTTQ
jgi:hypothetical protein